MFNTRFSQGQLRNSRNSLYRNHTWPVVVLVTLLVGGSLALAVIDESCRTAFTDLAQVGLGGYIALLIPHREKE